MSIAEDVRVQIQEKLLVKEHLGVFKATGLYVGITAAIKIRYTI